MGSRLDKNSNAVRKRIENHTFSDEAGEEYEASAFGGFPDYFRRKKIKLQNLDSELRASATDKPQIFKGVVAHITGYTQPPLHILHRDLVQHGAGFLQYLDSKTMATHIIASSLPPKKAIDFNRYRIVKPAWVTDSIQAGKLLPWSDYRVLEETPRQKTLKLDENGVFTQTHTQSSLLVRYREQTGNSFYTSQFRNMAGTDSEMLDISDPASRQESTSSNSIGRENGLVGPSSATANVPVSGDTHSSNGGRAVTPDMITDDAGQEMASADSPSERSRLHADRRLIGEPEENLNSDRKPKPLTSEEHNALLLQDPRMRKSSTANPDFLQQFYSESRLHHLSTWKAELKSKMQKLAAEKGPQKKPPIRKAGARRYIMHVDFDSFFCAVSLKKAPEYMDKPTVVAHGTGTGSEIASCNYPARKYGIKNGMWMKRAKELHPELKILPYDFPAYEEASKLFYESILEVGGVVQSVSIDEALIDATTVILAAVASDGLGVNEGSVWREQEKADQIALGLRGEIKQRTGCAVSVGIGGNILLAKVALRRAKPAGQYQIKPEEALGFLGELKVDDLPGVAYSIAGRLEEIGVKYVSDIRQATKERLINTLGPKTGEKLWDYARGIDRTEVGEQSIRKSVSAEVNWGIRFISQDEAEEFVFNLCKELEKRLLNEQVKGKQLTMKIMRRSDDAPLDPPKHLGHGKCDIFNKSVVFRIATHDFQVLGKEAVSILRSFKFTPGDLRGLGVQLTKLEPLKTSLAAPDGSQKRLSFGAFKTPGPAKQTVEDPIHDGKDGAVSPLQERRDIVDPIMDGPLTPRKPKTPAMHPALALARAGDRDAKAQTPLNISGTQFILPSQPDPAVLAELPADIRSRLMAQGRVARPSEPPRDETRSRTHTPPAAAEEIPPEIDPEVFHALPDDVKAEVLASYSRPRARQQTVLPQSPRRDRIIQQPPPKKPTPTKRGRPPGATSLRTRERQADATAGVVQTNFFARSRPRGGGGGGGGGRQQLPARAHQPRAPQPNHHQPDDVEEVGGEAVLPELEELDEAFLAELPADVRREVVADHRLRRAQRSGLDFKKRRRRPAAAPPDEDDPTSLLPGGQTRLVRFAPRPPVAAFTSGGLTGLSEVRDMVRAWHRATTRADGDGDGGGPHRRDVDMLARYLVAVVADERDLDKAAKLVRWLDYLVDEAEDEAAAGNEDEDGNGNGDGNEEEDAGPERATDGKAGMTTTTTKTTSDGQQAWRDVVARVKAEVQAAVRARGLGPLDLG
ncbi:impB/mucB/samB family protein [Xylariaceae sp. FL0804]|nr:impB/mucB/samB family protein [Xylariaceae sp. FL0804]